MDALADDPCTFALIEPVRVLEALVRPDLEPGMATAACLVGNGGEERRASAGAASVRQDVEPLQRAMLREPGRADDPAVALGDEERRVGRLDVAQVRVVAVLVPGEAVLVVDRSDDRCSRGGIRGPGLPNADVLRQRGGGGRGWRGRRAGQA